MDILQIVKLRVVAAALCVGSLLIGCSGDEDPQTLPPLPSASPTAAAAPPLPPEATPETSDGAAAFARHYLGVIGEAFAEANPTELQRLSAPGCEGCDALIESVQGLQAAGRKRVGGEYLVKTVAAPPVEEGNVIVDVSYERQPGRVVDAQGHVSATAPAVPTTNAQLRLIRFGGGWIVQGYRVVEL
jgi:hypothetical protein